MNYETFSDFFPSLEQEDVSFCVECGPPCRIGLGGRRNGTNIFPHLLSVTDYSHFLEDILVLPPSCDRLVDKAWPKNPEMKHSPDQVENRLSQ